jgi:hypothetical protein
VLGINLADVDTSEEAVNRFRRVREREVGDLRTRGLAGQLEVPFLSEEGKKDRGAVRKFEELNRLRGRRRL